MSLLRKASMVAGLTVVFAGTANASFVYSFTNATLFDFKFTAPSLLNVTTTIGNADLSDVVNHTPPADTLSLSSVQIFNPYTASPTIALFFTGGTLNSYTMNSWPGPFDHVGTYSYFTGAKLIISETSAVPEPSSLLLVLTALGGLCLVRSRVAIKAAATA